MAIRIDPGVGRALVRQGALVLWLAAVAGVAALWIAALPHNPPCCYDDEYSTAYNAWLIAQSGRDEYGARLPLYFEAFGEFRSPVQFYVMAGLFKVLGAHLLLGRYLTRTVGFLAVAAVGWLAYRISGRRWIGVAVALLGLTTPQLYEISRLGTEGPLILLPVALFLIAAWQAGARPAWGVGTGLLLAAPLAVAAYTYPTGRPLAPALAALLALFAGRRRLAGLLTCWAALALAMVPILVFMSRHPGALSHYAGELSWSGDASGPVSWLGMFFTHLGGNLDPARVLFSGDPNPRHHVGAWGALLIPFWLLAAGGFALVLLRRVRGPFWSLVAAGAVLVLLPAVLTRDVFHEPRLILVPLFGMVLCVPALQWLATRRHGRLTLGGLAALTVAQAVVFFATFVAQGTSAERHTTFEADFPRVFRAAQAAGQRPIWVLDKAYIDAFWLGVLDGVPRDQLVHWTRPEPPPPRWGPARHPDVTQWNPPPGTIVVAPILPCSGCRVLARGPNYNAWVQR